MNDKGIQKGRWKNAVIAVLIVAIIILILSGIISYRNFNNKSSNQAEKPKDEKKYEVLEVNESLVVDLFGLTRNNNRSLFFGTEYDNIYYLKDVINTNKLDVEFKLMLSFETLDSNKLNLDDETTVIEESALKEQYLKIFGDTDYKGQDIKYSCPSAVRYNEEKFRFEYDEYCGGPVSYGYQNKLIEARKYKDKIEIYEKVVFYLIDEDRVTYWKNADYSDFLLEMTMDDDFNIDSHLNELKTYKYTFEKSDSFYTFEKVELVK